MLIGDRWFGSYFIVQDAIAGALQEGDRSPQIDLVKLINELTLHNPLKLISI